MADPSSRFRARWLSENPQKPGDEGLGFLGFSQDSALLVGIHNLLAVQVGRKKARRLMLGGPKARLKSGLFSKTIADFDTDRFMAAINNN